MRLSILLMKKTPKRRSSSENMALICKDVLKLICYVFKDTQNMM